MEKNYSLDKEWERYIKLQKERSYLFEDNGLIHIVTDEEVIIEFQKRNNRKIGVIYESAYNMLVVDLVYQEEGKYFAYERLVPAVERGAVVIIPIYKDKMILLNQYRHVIRKYQYGFPRGFAEEGLSAEENCKKELIEEIGARVCSSKYLGQVSPDSGVQGNMVSVYMCEISEYDSSLHSEGICEILEFTQEQVQDILKQGKITDGFTLAALTLLSVK